jgi:hypothetical protein
MRVLYLRHVPSYPEEPDQVLNPRSVKGEAKYDDLAKSPIALEARDGLELLESSIPIRQVQHVLGLDSASCKEAPLEVGRGGRALLTR